jgi:hypothetical protein
MRYRKTLKHGEGSYQFVANAIAERGTARSIGGMLFECAICPAIATLMLVGLVGLLVVLRIQPF